MIGADTDLKSNLDLDDQIQFSVLNFVHMTCVCDFWAFDDMFSFYAFQVNIISTIKVDLKVMKKIRLLL